MLGAEINMMVDGANNHLLTVLDSGQRIMHDSPKTWHVHVVRLTSGRIVLFIRHGLSLRLSDQSECCAVSLAQCTACMNT